MKKSIIYSSSIFVMLTLLLGCSKSFLEEEPRGFLSEGTLKNSVGVEAALVGAYAMLDGYNIDNANTWLAGPHNWQLGSVPSDDAYKGSEQTDFPEFTQLEIYQWTSGNSTLNDKWVSLYEGVVRVNNTLRLLKGATDITAANASRIEGEARFLRAYYHFELYKVWGNIAYYTENDTDFYKSNVGGDPLGDAIKDLEAAVDLLPESQSDRGRANKFSARAMLGKLYMFKLAPDGKTPAPEAAKAEAQLQVVVDAKALAPCLKDVFQTKTENTDEQLFSVVASTSPADGANSRNSNWLNQLAFPAGPAFGCCGFHQPSQDLVNAYRVDPVTGLPALDFDTGNDANLDPATDFVDPRIDITIGRDDVPFLDWGVHAPNWIRDRTFSGPYSPKKFVHYKTEQVSSGGWNNNANNGINFPIIRLADAILLLAEAKVILGKLAEAETLVNKIRTRAGACSQGPTTDAAGKAVTGPDVITTNITDPKITWAKYKVSPYPVGTFAAQGPTFAMNAVRYERRLELALEGHRFFDLRRWKIGAQVLNKFVENTVKTRGYYKDAKKFDDDKNQWYPIPQSQINASSRNGQKTLTQNPGF